MQANKLLVTRKLPDAVEQRLAMHYQTTFNHDDVPLAPSALREALAEYDAIVPTITDRLDAACFSAGRAATTRIIANFGAGVEHIDVKAARAAGIAVTNTRDALTDATAELAITLMLMAARRTGEGERELRAGQWTGWRPTHLLGRTLYGQVLGLVGFGRIAQATARRARALGMQIVYFSRSRAAPDIERELDAGYVDSLRDLAAQADVLSLHVPGGSGTRHLIDAELLDAMKPGAILINTARGSIVDEGALVDALTSGPLGAAALDVFEREPAVEPRLLALENAVLLPHLGSATIEARTAMGMQAADNLDAFFAGRSLPNRIA